MVRIDMLHSFLIMDLLHHTRHTVKYNITRYILHVNQSSPQAKGSHHLYWTCLYIRKPNKINTKAKETVRIREMNEIMKCDRILCSIRNIVKAGSRFT
jgi:hypothetical protein